MLSLDDSEEKITDLVPRESLLREWWSGIGDAIRAFARLSA